MPGCRAVLAGLAAALALARFLFHGPSPPAKAKALFGEATFEASSLGASFDARPGDPGRLLASEAERRRERVGALRLENQALRAEQTSLLRAAAAVRRGEAVSEEQLASPTDRGLGGRPQSSSTASAAAAAAGGGGVGGRVLQDGRALSTGAAVIFRHAPSNARLCLDKGYLTLDMDGAF